MKLTHISRIYFGMAMPHGGDVSDHDWSQFEADHISPYFPDGYTVVSATGGWKDEVTGNTIHEATIVVEVAHDGGQETMAAIRIVAAVYKALFRQQAVMVQTVEAKIGFL